MTPRITYQPDDNAAYIRLSQEKVLNSAEVSPDVVFDYDAEGRIVGIEFLSKGRSTDFPPQYLPYFWRRLGIPPSWWDCHRADG